MTEAGLRRTVRRTAFTPWGRTKCTPGLGGVLGYSGW